jgi:hypothetical protein
LLFDFRQGRLIGLFLGQFEEDLALLYFFDQFMIPVQLFCDPRSFFEDRFGIIGVVPETVRSDLFFYFGQPLFFGSNVKDSP